MSIGSFSWQLEYGYGPLQIYFKKDCQAMAIQECYYFNRVGVHWGSVQFFSDKFFVVTYTCLSLVLTIDFCYSQLIFFCILFKKTQK